MNFSTKFFGVLFVLSFCMISAQYKSRIWDTGDGLSNNWISDITQDDKGYIWLATQYGLNRFDGYSFKNYTHNPENSNSLVANWVKFIERKSNNELWIGVNYGGLDVFETEKNEFHHTSIVHQKDTITSINSSITSLNGDLYIASYGGIFLKKSNKNNFKKIFDGNVIDITKNSSDQILFLTKKALYTYTSKTESTKLIMENHEEQIERIFVDSKDQLFGLENNHLSFIQSLHGTYDIYKRLKIDQLGSLLFAKNPIYENSENRIWIGCENGISIVNKAQNAIEFHPYTTLFQKDIGDVRALSFFEDIHNNMWIGTNKGLALISTYTARFQSSDVLPPNTKLNDVREFYQVGNTLLMASKNGLFSLNKEKKLQRILSERVYGMHMSNSGSLFSIGNGLFEIDTTTFKTATLSTSNFKGGWSIAEDKIGNLWMISDGNLIRYHKDSDTFKTFYTNNIPSLKDPPSIDLLIDSEGSLWLCTLKSGVYILKKPHKLELSEIPEFQNLTHIPGNKKSLSNPITTSMLETSDGTIWIGTDTGLNAVNPTNLEVKRYLKKDGLKDEKVMALVEDDLGNLWGSTIGHGIFELNKNTGVFNFFGQEDGLKSNNFLLSSSYKNEDGILFFGTDNGIETINPSLFRKFSRPKIDFFFTNTQLSSKSGEEQLRTFAPQKDELVLNHNDNSIIINYTTLNYHLAKKTKYKYKVNILHKTWQNNGNERSITFNSLPPGAYVLEVTAINPDLDFRTDVIAMKFIIKPPWWQTNLAYSFYILLLCSLLFTIHKYLLNRKLNIAEKNRLQELDVFKTSFFNNVAHEFKTPLTIISGMASNLQKKGKKEIDKTAKIISRNSNNLNNLVNQILDLSKLDVGKLNLEPTNGDIILFLKYILSSFDSLANAKEIRLHFLTDSETLSMDFDTQKTKYIFDNLISNAIKNTSVKGDIYLQVSNTATEGQFIVKDNGIGISQNDLKLIFNRYYQVKGQLGGTGIGLSFTKELVELMKGSISVESKVEQETSFTVKLPIKQNAPKDISFSYVPENPDGIEMQDVSNISEELPLIQIIDDNLDICAYLGSILKQDYRLNFNYTGDSGLQRVFNTVPDFVITDLMMPGKDGFEICREIKSNPITDHIPLIMLTAKSDSESKLEGLKLGADVYLEKPFDENELLIQISKLLVQRETLREKYRNTDFEEDRNETNKFVLKVKTIVEKNMENTSFGILELCRELGISRSHLHRKLKALTDLSTSAFIQTIKLQKARQLLKTSEKNVSEVAYEVGFDDPAYFSRLFSKTFGFPPSETRKNL